MSITRKQTLALVAPLAATALLATASAASADTAYNTVTGSPVSGGISGANVGNAILTASNVTVTCQSSNAAGAITSNSTGAGNPVAGQISSLSFGGTGAGGRCTTNSVAAPTASATTNITAGSPATVAALAGSPGSFNITSPVTAQITLFNSSGTSVAVCNYTTGAVSGSVPAGSSNVTFSQTLTGLAGNPFLCPKPSGTTGVPTYTATYRLTETSSGQGIAISNP